jgi:hypothetical protein
MKTCPSATLSTTNPTWKYPCANPGHHSEKVMTNSLSCGTAVFDSYSAQQEIKHYVTRQFITAVTESTLYHILSQQSPVHIFITSVNSFLISSSLFLGLTVFPSDFQQHYFYSFLASPMCATCSAHTILLDFITLILEREGQNLLCFYFYNFLSSPVTSSLRSTYFPQPTCSSLSKEPNIILTQIID